MSDNRTDKGYTDNSSFMDGLLSIENDSEAMAIHDINDEDGNFDLIAEDHEDSENVPTDEGNGHSSDTSDIDKDTNGDPAENTADNKEDDGEILPEKDTDTGKRKTRIHTKNDDLEELDKGSSPLGTRIGFGGGVEEDELLKSREERESEEESDNNEVVDSQIDDSEYKEKVEKDRKKAEADKERAKKYRRNKARWEERERRDYAKNQVSPDNNGNVGIELQKNDGQSEYDEMILDRYTRDTGDAAEPSEDNIVDNNDASSEHNARFEEDIQRKAPAEKYSTKNLPYGKGAKKDRDNRQKNNLYKEQENAEGGTNGRITTEDGTTIYESPSAASQLSEIYNKNGATVRNIDINSAAHNTAPTAESSQERRKTYDYTGEEQRVRGIENGAAGNKNEDSYEPQLLREKGLINSGEAGDSINHVNPMESARDMGYTDLTAGNAGNLYPDNSKTNTRDIQPKKDRQSRYRSATNNVMSNPSARDMAKNDLYAVSNTINSRSGPSAKEDSGSHEWAGIDRTSSTQHVSLKESSAGAGTLAAAAGSGAKVNGKGLPAYRNGINPSRSGEAGGAVRMGHESGRTGISEETAGAGISAAAGSGMKVNGKNVAGQDGANGNGHVDAETAVRMSHGANETGTSKELAGARISAAAAGSGMKVNGKNVAGNNGITKNGHVDADAAVRMSHGASGTGISKELAGAGISAAAAGSYLYKNPDKSIHPAGIMGGAMIAPGIKSGDTNEDPAAVHALLNRREETVKKKIRTSSELEADGAEFTKKNNIIRNNIIRIGNKNDGDIIAKAGGAGNGGRLNIKRGKGINDRQPKGILSATSAQNAGPGAAKISTARSSVHSASGNLSQQSAAAKNGYASVRRFMSKNGLLQPGSLQPDIPGTAEGGENGRTGHIKAVIKKAAKKIITSTLIGTISFGAAFGGSMLLDNSGSNTNEDAWTPVQAHLSRDGTEDGTPMTQEIVNKLSKRMQAYGMHGVNGGGGAGSGITIHIPGYTSSESKKANYTDGDYRCGDSQIITDGSGNWLLIDGGMSLLKDKTLAYLSQKGITSLTVMITHWHADHYSALNAILKNNNIQITKLICPDPEDSSANGAGKHAVEAVKKQGGEVLYPAAEELTNVSIGSINMVLWRKKPETLKRASNGHWDLNDTSIQSYFPDISYLSTGDIAHDMPNFLNTAGMQGKTIKVFKLAHHGNGSSNTVSTLKAKFGAEACWYNDVPKGNNVLKSSFAVSAKRAVREGLQVLCTSGASSGDIEITASNGKLTMTGEGQIYETSIPYMGGSSSGSSGVWSPTKTKATSQEYNSKYGFSPETEQIVEAHVNDFDHTNMAKVINSYGGPAGYAQALGGIFAKYYGKKVKVTTVQQFQEVMQYCYGLYTILGVDYDNGDHGYHGPWGDSTRYYRGTGKHAKHPGKSPKTSRIDDLLKPSTKKTVNCNFGEDMALKKAGLLPLNGVSSVCFYNKMQKKGGTKITDKSQLQPGDVMCFFRDSACTNWFHTSVVYDVLADGTVLTYDTGRGACGAGKLLKVFNEKNYPHWFAVHFFNLTGTSSNSAYDAEAVADMPEIKIHSVAIDGKKKNPKNYSWSTLGNYTKNKTITTTTTITNADGTTQTQTQKETITLYTTLNKVFEFVDADGNPIDFSSTSSGLGGGSSGAATGTAAKILQIAASHVGGKYAMGGNNWATGVDCSHYVTKVMQEAGVYNGGYRDSWGWETAGRAVSSLSQAQAGDVICYGEHVAIYDGNGMIYEAKGKAYGITHDRRADCKTIKAIRRLIPDGAGSVTATASASGSSASGTGYSPSGSSQAAGGRTITIPSGLGKIHTYMGWQLITAKSSTQYKLRQQAGMNFDSEGFGIINGRYVIACTTTYGNVGDLVDFYQDNGSVLHCIIGDIKNQSDSGCNKWGHDNGKCIVEFVVDKNKWYSGGKGSHVNPGNPSCHPEWSHYITKAVNYGSWFNGASASAGESGTGGSSAGETYLTKMILSMSVLGSYYDNPADFDKYKKYCFDVLDYAVAKYYGADVEYVTYDTYIMCTATVKVCCDFKKLEQKDNNFHDWDLWWKKDGDRQPLTYMALTEEQFCKIFNVTLQDLSAGTASPFTGVKEQVYEFFRDKGLNAAQIAGIMANIERESSFNPKIQASNGASGFFQWMGGRFAALKSYAAGMGKDWTDVQAQLEYAWKEINGSGWYPASAKAKFMSTTDAYDAGYIFCKYWERPGGSEPDARGKLAKKYYSQIMSAQMGSNINYVQWALTTAADNSHGYSMGNRGGHPDYDCSSFVASALRASGYKVSLFTTVTEASELEKAGFTKHVYNHSQSQLKPGDILMYDHGGGAYGHTEIYVGDGKNVGAHSNYDGRTGDSSGREICVKSTNNDTRGWQYYFRLWN